MSLELYRQIAALEQRLRALESREVPQRSAGGTFTPIWLGTTTGGTFTYSEQTGVWARDGERVFYVLRLTISAISVAPVGNMRVAGMSALPLPRAGLSYPATIGQLSSYNVQASALFLTAWVISESSEARISPRQVFDDLASNQMPASQFTNAAIDIGISGWYNTDG